MTSGRQGGLRLQIVLALAGLMALAFVPLFFAVASLARATAWATGEQSARAVARSVAASVEEAWAARAPGGAGETLRTQVRALAGDGVLAVCAFAREDGRSSEARPACAGSVTDAAALATAPPTGTGEALVGQHGGLVDVRAPVADAGWVVVRMRVDDATTRTTPLVRLVALYMTTFALALIVFAYFALTRLIVRPVDELVRAADRVSRGARSLRVPRSGPREIEELATSMQAMAERLMAEEATLQLKVEELTETARRLTEAQEQLVRSERLASVGRLAAGLAHEIGNPLTALMGMQDLLLDGDPPPETQRDFLRRMRSETERIHGVLRDLLDFARPEHGGSPALSAGTSGEGKGEASVRGALDDVIALVRPQKTFRGMKITTDVQGDPSVAMAAPQLTQVLLNLFLNAGAALLAARREGGAIVARVKADGRRVRVEIEDDGPGIAPEVRGRLFEPFVTTKPTGEGTGLGLAVCRGLVESAGGSISVDASYEAGARFVIELPAANEV